jgi:hypothetical protein
MGLTFRHYGGRPVIPAKAGVQAGFRLALRLAGMTNFVSALETAADWLSGIIYVGFKTTFISPGS